MSSRCYQNGREALWTMVHARLGIAGEVPYDPIVTKAMVAGKSIVEFDNGSISTKIKEMWEKVETKLRG
jgi:MinD superfamily P-loop ATPase